MHTNLQVHDRICAVALAAKQHKITVQITRVQPRYRQSVAVACQRHCVHILRGSGLRRRTVHVLEQLVLLRARNTAAAVRDLNRDVLAALADRYLNWRHSYRVLAVVLHHGAHRVLEDLKQHVVQM